MTKGLILISLMGILLCLMGVILLAKMSVIGLVGFFAGVVAGLFMGSSQ